MQVDHGLLARETSFVLYMHLNNTIYTACMSAIINYYIYIHQVNVVFAAV